MIIDDEVDARRVIHKYLERHFPAIEVEFEADSVLKAVELLNENEVDLIFLDVQLSDGTGFDVLDNLTQLSTPVIFTTAYDQYAVKAFRYHALDYLLKPIQPDELIVAVNQALKDHKPTVKSSSVVQWMETYGQVDRKLAVPTADGFRFVLLEEISYIEADSSYSTVVFKDKKEIVVSKPLKYFCDKLDQDATFLRTHKSFLVNIRSVVEYLKEDGGYLKLDSGKMIPISRQKKEEIVEKINQFFL